MKTKPIILSQTSLADAVDALSLDEVADLLTAEVHGYGVQVQLVRSRGEGGAATVAELPDLDRWVLRTRHGQPYIVRVRVLDANDCPVGQAYLDWWGSQGNSLQAEAVFVAPEHRRRGLASAMYSLAGRATGLIIVPSAYQTPEGKALWAGTGGFGRAA